MNREELKKIIQGTPVTTLTPFDDDFNVDLVKVTDMTRWWVEQGLGTDVAPLKVTAAMGEGPELSDDEWPHILRTTVLAAGNRNVICALKPKNTLQTIEDAKRAQGLGAIGLQIDLPFFHHSNQDDLVRHFTDISDAVDIGIMIYNTHWFTFNPQLEYLQPGTMLRLKDAEHVVAIKWSVPEGEDYDGMTQFSHIFNVIDNTGQSIRCHKNGGRGYISSMIAVHAEDDLAIWQLMEQGEYNQAQEKKDRVTKAFSDWQAKTANRSGGYRQGKGLLAAKGLPVGPPRPPTLPCSDDEVAEARGIMKKLGWVD